MTPRRAFSQGMSLGVGLMAIVIGLHADWLGREGYSKYVLDHWVSVKISIPIEILGLLYCIFTVAYVLWDTGARRTAERERVTSVALNVPKPGARHIRLSFEQRGGREIGTSMPVHAAEQLAINIGAAIQTARGKDSTTVSADTVEPERERRSAWEKIDLKDLAD